MQIELSEKEIETALRCIKAHITTLSAVMIKDTSGMFNTHTEECEKLYKKLSNTLKDHKNEN